MTGENTIWHFLFLLFAIAGDGKELMDLMYSENFNEDFNRLIQKFSDMDSDDFKDTCLKALIDKKEVAMELNKAYREMKKDATTDSE